MNICVKSDNDNSNSGETSAAAATISTTALCSIITTKTTKIRVMKKEKKMKKEEEEIVENHLGSDDETMDQKINYGNGIKEEKVETEEANNDDNKNDLDRDPLPAAEHGEKYRHVYVVNSYADWKTGSWCWLSLSPAKKDNDTGSNICNTMTSCNNQQQQQQQLSQPQVIRNSTPTCGVKSEDICVDNNSINDGNIDFKRKAMLDGVFNDDDSIITGSNDTSSPTKKLKFGRYNNNDDGNDHVNKSNSNGTTTGIIKKEEIDRAISNNKKDQKRKTNDKSKNKNTRKVNGIKKEEGNNEYKVDDIVSANTNSNDNNNSIRDTNKNNDNGYESWTEGNWCWLIKPSSSRGVASSSSRGGVDFASTKQKKTNEDIENETHVDSKYNEEDVDNDDNTEGADGNEVGSEDGNNDGYDDDDDVIVTDDGYESWTEGNWCWLLPNISSSATKTTTTNKIVRSSMDVTRTTHTIRVYYRTRTPTTKTPQKDMIYTQNQNERWNKMYQQLGAYKEKYKTTNVPYRCKKYPQLGVWVKEQRRKYKEEIISNHRVDLLNSIQFVWDQKGMQWNNMYQRLLTYQNKHKSTSVSRYYKEDTQLATWVNHQRQCYKNKELSIERLNLLESIGFIWKIQDHVPWIETYQKLVAYKQHYQSTLVPRKHTEDPHLGDWVSHQRHSNNKGKLSERQKELLNSIDFVWSAKK